MEGSATDSVELQLWNGGWPSPCKWDRVSRRHRERGVARAATYISRSEGGVVSGVSEVEGMDIGAEADDWCQV